MTTGAMPICVACARLDMEGPATVGLSCAAFPEGIPEEIVLDGFDHRRPFGGERDGLLFELAPGKEAALAAYES